MDISRIEHRRDYAGHRFRDILDEAVLVGRHRVNVGGEPTKTGGVELYPKSPDAGGTSSLLLSSGTPSAAHDSAHPFADIINQNLADRRQRSLSANSSSQHETIECLLATPSVPHRGGPSDEEGTPEFGERALDHISTTPLSSYDRPLSGDQTGALFAQFSLPVSNFHVLPQMIPRSFKWGTAPRHAQTHAQGPITSQLSMENFIPSC